MVAGPVAHIKKGRGGDTGHWKAIEDLLTQAYNENGTDRGASQAWIRWENTHIDDDNLRYLPTADTVADDEGRDFQSKDDGEGEDPNDNGDVDTRNLGDMAALS